MAYSKKTWKDRITEYPNRRELTHSDSSTELVTVARSEGTISQEGDAFSAQNMNDLEGRIDSEFSAVDQNLQDINDNLSGFKYYPIGTAIVGLVADDTPYTDANGNYILADSATGRGMIDNITYKSISSTEKTCGEVGADTCSPFSPKAELLWTNPNPTASSGFAPQKVSIDLTDYEAVIVEVRTNNGSDAFDYQPRSRAYIVKENLNGNWITIGRTIQADGTGYSRVVTDIDNTGITFGVALSGATGSNNAAIPMYIYGIKNNILT